MPAPLLLVDDDLGTIAQVKRLLAREGYEVVLATNAADAVIAWGHHLPPLVLLNPRVESDRGRIVLEELRSHPDAKLLHVLMLGETVAGFGYPVAPLPLDPGTFAQSVNELVQGTTSAEGWHVHVSPRTRTEVEEPLVPSIPRSAEEESWRATRKSPAPGRSEEPVDGRSEAPVGAPPGTLETRLFGDLEAQLASEVEAQAMASVDESLARLPVDEAQQALEDDVRAEGARRRKLRAQAEAPSIDLPKLELPAAESGDLPGQRAHASGADVSGLHASWEGTSDADASGEETSDADASDANASGEDSSGAAASGEETSDADASGEDSPEAAASGADSSGLGADEPHARESEDAVAARLQADSARARETLARAELIAAAAQRRADELDASRATAAEQLEQLKADLETARSARLEAEKLAEQERALHRQREASLTREREKVAGEETQLWEEVARLEGELAKTRGQLTERSESAAMLELELTDTKETLQKSMAGALQLDVELTNTKENLQKSMRGALELELSIERANAEAEELRVKQSEAEASQAERSSEVTQTAQQAVRQLEDQNTRASDALAEKTKELDALQATVAAAEAAIEAANAQLEAKSAELEQAREEAKAELEEASVALASKSAELEQALAAANAARDSKSDELEQARVALEAIRSQFARANEDSTAQADQLQTSEAARATLHAEVQALTLASTRALDSLRDAIDEAEHSEARAEKAQSELAVSAEAAEATRRTLEQAQAQLEASTARANDAEAAVAQAQARSTAAEQGLHELQAEVEKLKTDFAAAHQSQRRLEEALEDARAANLEVRARADQSETRARVLEERSLLPLKVPNRAPLSVPRFGKVELGELARLVGQLVLSHAEVRLELAAPGGRRVLWLSRGAIVAAESGFGNESLLDRARRDALIDARQANELQMVRSATPAETVVVLKERGLLREAEVVPLVQRYTEQVALDGFSEPTSEYRIVEETPGPETLGATLPRPTLPLVAEALRRALPVEELLQRLGGSEAVPISLESELDLRGLGFADKERRMLGYCNGEANVEDLALASGLKADVAFRALLIARLLGMIELRVPARTAVALNPEIDVQRLEAKFEQVQESDYFTMLGLGRAAGSDEVLRAWTRLSEEFDPLRYSGHPDAGLQQRAQVVYSVLEEAAKALGDDRRRAEYARHLVD